MPKVISVIRRSNYLDDKHHQLYTIARIISSLKVGDWYIFVVGQILILKFQFRSQPHSVRYVSFLPSIFYILKRGSHRGMIVLWAWTSSPRVFIWEFPSLGIELGVHIFKVKIGESPSSALAHSHSTAFLINRRIARALHCRHFKEMTHTDQDQSTPWPVRLWGENICWDMNHPTI